MLPFHRTTDGFLLVRSEFPQTEQSVKLFEHRLRKWKLSIAVFRPVVLNIAGDPSHFVHFALVLLFEIQLIVDDTAGEFLGPMTKYRWCSSLGSHRLPVVERRPCDVLPIGSPKEISFRSIATRKLVRYFFQNR